MILRHLLLSTLLCLLAHWPVAQAQDNPDAAQAAPPVQVELIQAGQPPLQKLRYQPQAGAKTAMVMSMDMEQNNKVGGVAPPTPAIPTQQFTIAIDVTEVSAGGNVRFEFEYTDADVVDDPNNPAPAAAPMRQAIKPLIGLSGHSIITDRGFIEGGDMNVPDGAPPMIKTMLESLRQSMQNMSSPLPEEPVGVGAQWKVTQPVTNNGMSLMQTTTYKIQKIAGNRVTLDVALDQEAEPQNIKSPMLPPGTKLKLKSLDTEGDGRLVLALDSIVPAESTMQIESNASMEINAGGQQQPMSTQTKMKMTLTAADEANE